MKINWLFYLNMLVILCVGVAAVYSASYFREDQSLRILWQKQIQWICLGMFFYFFIALNDYKWLKFGAIPLYLIALACLIFLSLGPEPIVRVVNDARSWIRVGGFQFQPSQAAMFAGIAMIALVLSHLPQRQPIFARFPILLILLVGLLAGIPCLLVLKEPDIGSASVWAPVALLLLLAGGFPFRYIIALILGALTILPLVYFLGLKGYQKKRVEIWLDMLREKPVDVRGDAYAATNNMTAIGSAGFAGKGFKAEKSMNKLELIPRDVAVSDYIFVVLAEEHGFRGMAIVLILFAALLAQVLLIAFYSRDLFGALLCTGVLALFLGHIFQNVGMTVLLAPITGIPLPLISYGGTFICITMALLGVAQSVWVHRK